jgi:hypothetical protein
MSGNYENEAFESDSMGRGSAIGIDEKKHLLKLSVDFLSVKEMKVSAQISV